MMMIFSIDIEFTFSVSKDATCHFKSTKKQYISCLVSACLLHELFHSYTITSLHVRHYFSLLREASRLLLFGLDI